MVPSRWCQLDGAWMVLTQRNSRASAHHIRLTSSSWLTPARGSDMGDEARLRAELLQRLAAGGDCGGRRSRDRECQWVGDPRERHRDSVRGGAHRRPDDGPRRRGASRSRSRSRERERERERDAHRADRKRRKCSPGSTGQAGAGPQSGLADAGGSGGPGREVGRAGPRAAATDERQREREKQQASAEAAAREERALELELAPPVQWDVMLSRDGQSALDALLFPRGALLERGSALHRDFGEFFERYVAFRKKELARNARGTEGGGRQGAAAVGGGGEGGGGVHGVAAKAGDGLGRWVAREDDMTEEARWKRKLAQFVTEIIIL